MVMLVVGVHDAEYRICADTSKETAWDKFANRSRHKQSHYPAKDRH